MIHLTFKRLGV
jgi:hypothetical protein